MAATLTAFAPAKVNLYLHVGAARADGLHPINSLMVFADVGDELSVRTAGAISLEVRGPFAEGLSPGDDNLVLRAAKAILAQVRGPRASFHLVLNKALPLAAGLGGGSSDAGATLRLLREHLEADLTDAQLEEIAAGLGADGPACLFARSVIAEGIGERLSPAPAFPVLDAVLVNPRAASPTGPVYRGFDEMGAAAGADRPELPNAFESTEEMAGFLRGCRNDLEAPAARLTPQIAEVLDTLRDEPETLLARLSGSGATCFALCAGDIEAEGLAERMERMRPDWWVQRCRLGGDWI